MLSLGFGKEFALALVAWGWGPEKPFAKPAGPRAELVKPMSGRPWPENLLRKTSPGACKAFQNLKIIIVDPLFSTAPASGRVKVFLSLIKET